MALLTLDLSTLGELNDGAAQVIINAALREAARDLDDRGHEDGKPRKVAIELTFRKRKNGEVDVAVAAQVKVPARATASTTARIRAVDGQSQLIFQQHAPDDPNQRTLDETEARNRSGA